LQFTLEVSFKLIVETFQLSHIVKVKIAL